MNWQTRRVKELMTLFMENDYDNPIIGRSMSVRLIDHTCCVERTGGSCNGGCNTCEYLLVQKDLL